MKRISGLEQKYVREVLKNGFRTSLNSVFNNRLEKRFAQAFGARFAIGHVNGTATLHTALAALGVKPGDEVIVPPLTMSSPAIAVLQNGSIPVFADVERGTFTIDAKAIQRCVTRKTKAVITVSLYGLSPDYDQILAVCRKHKLFLIEDNAQCFLGRYKGKRVGSFGDFASYSFQASKHMATGEGGMLTTDREALADRARKFNSLGYAGVNAKQGKISRDDIQDPAYERHVTLGFNYRMSELVAAVALGQLERLNEFVEQRRKVAALFDKALKGNKHLRRQEVPEGIENTYWTYAAVLQTVDPKKDWYRFRELFKKNGGDGFYAAWKLSYQEPLFRDRVQGLKGIWQDYQKPLCPTAEYLQPRLVQFKTNYWQISEARRQADTLKRTLDGFFLQRGS